MTVTNKPGHRGEHEGNRKTIARGMPGRSGVTVVTTLVCFLHFAREAAGRIWRLAFPAPSDFEGRTQSKTRAKTRGEIAKLYLAKCAARLTSPRKRGEVNDITV
jgi:hypothetical protein